MTTMMKRFYVLVLIVIFFAAIPVSAQDKVRVTFMENDGPLAALQSIGLHCHQCLNNSTWQHIDSAGNSIGKPEVITDWRMQNERHIFLSGATYEVTFAPEEAKTVPPSTVVPSSYGIACPPVNLNGLATPNTLEARTGTDLPPRKQPITETSVHSKTEKLEADLATSQRQNAILKVFSTIIYLGLLAFLLEQLLKDRKEILVKPGNAIATNFSPFLIRPSVYYQQQRQKRPLAWPLFRRHQL